MAYIYATSKLATSITCEVRGLDTAYSYYDRYVDWYYNGVYKGWNSIDAYVSSGGSCTASGLQASTTYNIEARIYKDGSGTPLATLTGTATTASAPKLDTPYVVNGSTTKGSTFITFTINSANATYYYMDCYLGATQIGSRKGGSSGSFSWTGLNANTQYTFYYYATASGYTDSNTGTAYATTQPGGWDWVYTKTSGSGFNITGAEWLAFINKIQETRAAYGLASYGFTTAASYFAKGQPFYYWIFRQASQAIDDMNGQVPNEFMLVVPGDNIFAWYFDTLRTALNNAIGAL